MVPESTQPEVALSRFRDVNFTVHEYLDSSSTRADQNTILEKGYDIVRAAVSGEDWKPMKIGPNKDNIPSKNSYAFNSTPPILRIEMKYVKEVKEWGSIVSEHEVFRLHDLEDFAGCDLSHILLAGGVQAETFLADPIASTTRAQNEVPPAEPEPKRRKLNLGSLYHIVPQPHIHPSPFSPSDVPVKGRPYKKAEGTFRWDRCTSGELLDDSHTLPFPSDSGTSDLVSWTEDSLLKFWQFLLELQKIGSLGPLGISFHASRNDKSSSTSSTKIHSSASGLTPYKATADTSTSSSKLSNLAMVDYIKIYHDAPKTLHVRYALDIWQYQSSCEDGQAQKTRMLKGARLVLVDEASQGVLVL